MFPKVADKKFEFKRDAEGSLDKRSYAIRKDVQEAVRETKKEYPAVAGFTLFGSRTKGMERENSDVDVILFRDVDHMTKLAAKKWTDMNPELFFKVRLKKLLTDSLGLEEAETIIQGTRVYSTGLMRSGIENGLTRIARLNNGELKNDIERIQARNEWDNFIQAPTGVVSGLFYMEVGTGLKPWRKLVIDTLQQFGPTGEKLWQEIMQDVKHSHEDHRPMFNKSNRPVQHGVFPMSLREARKTYL